MIVLDPINQQVQVCFVFMYVCMFACMRVCGCVCVCVCDGETIPREQDWSVVRDFHFRLLYDNNNNNNNIICMCKNIKNVINIYIYNRWLLFQKEKSNIYKTDIGSVFGIFFSFLCIKKSQKSVQIYCRMQILYWKKRIYLYTYITSYIIL